MNPKYDIQLMVKVAQMYYEQGLKQEDIAKQLGISRSSISMVLTEAKEYGIVQVNIKDPFENNQELSEKIKQTFHINECIVIPTMMTEANILTKISAHRAANIVRKELNNNATIGIAWGITCYEFMNSFKNKELIGVNVVPLIGGTNRVNSQFQLNEMVRMFADKINGIPTFIHAPAIPETVEDKNLYLQSYEMQIIQKLWRNLDIAVISVGASPEYYDDSKSYILSMDKKEYEEDRNKVVGDICARNCNIYGEFLENEYNSKIIGIPIEDLKNAKRVICVASGKHKVLSIIAALRSEIVDLLITDENTAKNVLDEMNI